MGHGATRHYLRGGRGASRAAGGRQEFGTWLGGPLEPIRRLRAWVCAPGPAASPQHLCRWVCERVNQWVCAWMRACRCGRTHVPMMQYGVRHTATGLARYVHLQHVSCCVNAVSAAHRVRHTLSKDVTGSRADGAALITHTFHPHCATTSCILHCVNEPVCLHASRRACLSQRLQPSISNSST